MISPQFPDVGPPIGLHAFVFALYMGPALLDGGGPDTARRQGYYRSMIICAVAGLCAATNTLAWMPTYMLLYCVLDIFAADFAWDNVLHHIIVAALCTAIVTDGSIATAHNKIAPYLWATELSTVALNIRALTRRGSLVNKMASWAFAVLFLVLRCVALPFGLSKIMHRLPFLVQLLFGTLVVLQYVWAAKIISKAAAALA